MRLERLPNNPIIHLGLDPSLAGNINGPSLIEAPDWLPNRLGRYYLYFGHHSGQFIRLAVADELTGPWRVIPQGTLQLSQSLCAGHIASPEVVVDHERRRLVMYYHGPATPRDKPRAIEVCKITGFNPSQITRAALSDDGIHFTALTPIIAPSYFRVFHHEGWWYGVAMPMVFYRSANGLDGWEQGPTFTDHRTRHSAVLKRGDRLDVFFSRREDCPERIVRTTFDLRGDWKTWSHGPIVDLARPEHDWEGVNEPLVPSRDGKVMSPMHQLRDPAVYQSPEGVIYLLYSVAGEQGIAIGRLHLD